MQLSNQRRMLRGSPGRCGCCDSAEFRGRPAEKNAWHREWKDEQCSEDREYEFFAKQAEARCVILGE